MIRRRRAAQRRERRAAVDRVVASLQTPEAKAVSQRFPGWLVGTTVAVAVLSFLIGLYAASSASYRLGSAPSSTVVRTGRATIESCGRQWWPQYVPRCTARVQWDGPPRPHPDLRLAGDETIAVHPTRPVSGTIAVTSYVDNSMTLARPRVWGAPEEWVVPADTRVGDLRDRWISDLLMVVLPLGATIGTAGLLSGVAMRRARNRPHD